MRESQRITAKPLRKVVARTWRVEGVGALETIQNNLNQSVAKLEPLLQRIANTDRLIDLIVYQLYGVTEEEAAIVEGQTR